MMMSCEHSMATVIRSRVTAVVFEGDITAVKPVNFGLHAIISAQTVAAPNLKTFCAKQCILFLLPFGNRVLRGRQRKMKTALPCGTSAKMSRCRDGTEQKDRAAIPQAHGEKGLFPPKETVNHTRLLAMTIS
jgi:hypothetical protein